MNPEITKEQQEQLSSWASQRDLLLSEISSLRDTERKLHQRNEELSSSSSEIINKMNQAKGRIEELKIKEAELPELTRKDVSTLKVIKSGLETEILFFKENIKELKDKKDLLEKSISFLTDTFNSLHERVGVLDKVVGHVTEISSKNDKSIQNLVVEIKKGLTEVVEKNKQSVKEMSTVTAELPKVFLEVQRKSLERQVINNKKHE